MENPRNLRSEDFYIYTDYSLLQNSVVKIFFYRFTAKISHLIPVTHISVKNRFKSLHSRKTIQTFHSHNGTFMSIMSVLIIFLQSISDFLTLVFFPDNCIEYTACVYSPKASTSAWIISSISESSLHASINLLIFSLIIL